MNIDIKILTIINIILILYICTCMNKNVEKMSDVNISSDIINAVNQIYDADVESIRNLGEIAKQLQDGGLEINGNVTITGNLIADKNVTIKGSMTVDTTINIKGSMIADTTVNIKGDATFNKRVNVSDKIVITGPGPALYLKDTNHRSGMVHMNDNKMYFLSGNQNSEDWSQVDGQWPLYLQTNTNEAFFGGNINTPGKIVINNGSPTLYLKDTSGRSGMVHMNDDRMYFLSGNQNSEDWSPVNGEWPLYLQTNTNEAVFGGPILLKIHGDKGVSTWKIANFNDQNLCFYENDVRKGYIENDNGDGRMNFTGQHRCFIQDIPFSNTKYYQGMIVCANKNINISMAYSIKKGNQAITQNETLPYCSLACKNYDKSCFGVISDSEDPDHRVDKFGSFCTPYEKENGDTRIYINSVGEGAIWVTNMNGPLESGDYITTSNLPGYGMKQHDDLLHNYTVAKITMDCDFNPKLQPVPNIMKDSSGNNILDKYNMIQWTDLVNDSGNIVYEYEYNIRYLNKNGKIINKKEYNMIGGFIAAYVGCTYHCG